MMSESNTIVPVNNNGEVPVSAATNDGTANKTAPSPLVSIVVIAYNHLNYTKQCIESIYKYTSHIDFELITINNGSTDGTEEYFNSLPNTRKINFPENIGVCKAINHGFRIAKGKYTLNVSNDIVVTTRWLDNLLICMESNPKIGMAVPVCDASCNYQQIYLPYQDLEDMQVQAEIYNVSNPDFWEERLKLCTYAGIYRTDLQKSLGGFDEDFNPGSYDDDAICFSIRRRGFKVILAKDTFVHHYGACSFNIEYEKDNTLLYRNKATFMRKFGVNPYVAGLIDYNVLNILTYNGTKDVNILGLGGSYGTTVLQLKNFCKSHGSKNVGLYYFSEHPGNMIELNTICDDCMYGTMETLEEKFGSRQYDYIILESDSNQLTQKTELFTILFRLLSAGGQLVCTASSPELYEEILEIFTQLGAELERHENQYYLCFTKDGKNDSEEREDV